MVNCRHDGVPDGDWPPGRSRLRSGRQMTKKEEVKIVWLIEPKIYDKLAIDAFLSWLQYLLGGSKWLSTFLAKHDSFLCETAFA